MIYIVAKGITMTTAACCWASGGPVRRLPQSNFVGHDPADQQAANFVVTAEFKRDHPEVTKALRAACGAKASRWKIVKPDQKTRCAAPARPGPARGGQLRSVSSASGDAPGNSAKISGCAATRGPKQAIEIKVTNLDSLWSALQMMRRVRNSKHAPLAWRAERVAM